MQRKENEHTSNEESDEYVSEDNDDDDYFVDNLKHFTNATQSRFIENNVKEITQKASTSTNDTSFQDLHKLSTQSNGLPNQVYVL